MIERRGASIAKLCIYLRVCPSVTFNPAILLFLRCDIPPTASSLPPPPPPLPPAAAGKKMSSSSPVSRRRGGILACLCVLSTPRGATSFANNRAPLIPRESPSSRRTVPRRGRGGREAAAEYALRTTTPSGLDENGSDDDDVDDDDEVIAAGPLRRSVGGARKLAAAIALGSALSFSPLAQPQASRAYEASDYASETVTTTVEKLRRSAGNIDESFRTFEEIAAIIAEGKGVGGSVSACESGLERHRRRPSCVPSFEDVDWECQHETLEEVVFSLVSPISRALQRRSKAEPNPAITI